MTLLLDINVILDIALQRSPWQTDSESALRHCRKEHQSFIAWHSYPTLFYILRRNQVPADQTRLFLRSLASWTNVAETHQKDLLHAFDLPIPDFEDALQCSAAEAVAADYILTRNTRDFTESPVPAISPIDFLRLTATP